MKFIVLDKYLSESKCLERNANDKVSIIYANNPENAKFLIFWELYLKDLKVGTFSGCLIA